MTQIIHSTKCLKAQSDMHNWMKKYPNHCKKCYGAGYHHYPATRHKPKSYEECSCLFNGKCPRCSAKLQYDLDDAICLECGWHSLWLLLPNIVQLELEFICPDVECYCWENQEEEWYAEVSGTYQQKS